MQSVLAAASDTTGNAMTVSAYHTVSNPEIFSTLKKELAKAFPDPNKDLSFVELEKLPYLVSDIQVVVEYKLIMSRLL